MPFDPIAYINEPRWMESRLGLDRIRELLDRLARPQDRLKFVHVAGTNGKGSTCAYLASILQAAGLRTGLFTRDVYKRQQPYSAVDPAAPASARPASDPLTNVRRDTLDSFMVMVPSSCFDCSSRLFQSTGNSWRGNHTRHVI